MLDFAGGSGTDSATLAIGHVEVRGTVSVVVVDCTREYLPPFSPPAVAADVSTTMKPYGCTHAVSDKFGGQFPIEEMARHGILVEPSAAPKSDLYRELVPIVNAGRLELLDHARTVAQLCALERRTARGGRDSIDHAPGGHDDCANVVALLAAAARAVGLPPLPAAFTQCYREQSGLPSSNCYLFAESGDYSAAIYSSDPCCRACPGHRAVIESWRQDARGLDLRSFRWQVWGDSDFSRRRREGRAWALVRQNDDGRGAELIPGL